MEASSHISCPKKEDIPLPYYTRFCFGLFLLTLIRHCVTLTIVQKHTSELIIAGGPMFARKTTWLLEQAENLPPGTYQFFKPGMDNRYGENVVATHDGKSVPALNLDVTNPIFPEMSEEISTVLIDELNFFAFQTLLPQIEKLLDEMRNVVGVGLLYDFQKNPFGATVPLAKMADEFIQLHAICDGCGGPAVNSYRKVEAQGQILVGAAESYGVCCDACWSKFSKPLK
jgi:thymidine kinase